MSVWFQRFGHAEVLPSLFVGAYPLDGEDVREIAELGVDHVYSLVEDREYGAGEHEAVTAAYAEAGIEELRAAMVDYGGLPLEILERAVTEVVALLEAGRRVYLHCRAGWQRSAAVAAGVVALREAVDIDTALLFVNRRKPNADPLAHQRADLRLWFAFRVQPPGRP